MNLIKCPILEIHSERPMESSGGMLVEVDLTYYYCGHVQRFPMIFLTDEWEIAKERGYFFS